ncbi:MAG: 2-hydroxy-3-oxopropionate reductase [Gammaproteobacteria bacterium]|nr:2-hydroxy-3-oxopropionate reductase [Gammaproteobacteria bacterium]
MAETIGFIGLGIMGQPMAINLRKAGYEVWVHARRPESMQPVVAAGATACDSAREVAEHVSIIFTMVSDTPDVEAVILGENGIIEGVHTGSVVVDMSTISPTTTRVIADMLETQGVEMLDAPVSGGEKGAIDGALSIMVGGKAEVFERVKPMFEVMGKNIVHIGDNGAGQVTKACNQVVIAQAISAIGEAYLLAESNGVDPRKVREALMGGFAGSRALESHGERMLDGNYQPGFKAKLHQKDMRIVMQTAEEMGIALPGAAAVTQLINTAVGQGMGEDDSISIFRLQQKLSGVKVNKD